MADVGQARRSPPRHRARSHPPARKAVAHHHEFDGNSVAPLQENGGANSPVGCGLLW
jgi:hypothetical protein